MLNYRDCKIEDFNHAISLKDENVKEISTEFLYILYTKFMADSARVKCNNSYSIGIHYSSKNKAEVFEKELIERGVLS